MSVRTVATACVAAGFLAAAGGSLWWSAQAHRREEVRQALAGMDVPSFGAQKVVYHVGDGGGLFDRHFRNVLGSLRNHVRAVGQDKLTARVVLQGPGIHLLRDARDDDGLREAVDWLRAHGVRFEVCRNSLVDQAVLPSELYGVEAKDIVPAGVAELARLEADGFTYLRL